VSQNFTFAIAGTDDTARAGVIETPHGRMSTPVFMPVGTQATVKALTPEDVHDVGAEIILSNTYHLLLRPGLEIIERFGGLHQFMAWEGPILTDSGGFQVFSLGHLRKLSDDGVTFRSHIDGSEHTLTPEFVVEAQECLGSDIAMVLDHCPSYGDDDETIRKSLERTHKWAERSLSAHQRKDQALFGIVQGGWATDLRKESAKFIASLDFSGIAIGGLSVGEPKQIAYQILDETIPHLPTDKPRYLMGVGSPDGLIESIARGIDMFDCTLPTRIARNGGLFTPEGRINLRGARYREQEAPIAKDCDCYTCSKYSSAYLYHLLRSEELLYHRLATIHNLRFVVRLMKQAREAILNGYFAEFAADFLGRYQATNEETRLAQKAKWLAAHRHWAESQGKPR